MATPIVSEAFSMYAALEIARRDALTNPATWNSMIIFNGKEHPSTGTVPKINVELRGDSPIGTLTGNWAEEFRNEELSVSAKVRIKHSINASETPVYDFGIEFCHLGQSIELSTFWMLGGLWDTFIVLSSKLLLFGTQLTRLNFVWAAHRGSSGGLEEGELLIRRSPQDRASDGLWLAHRPTRN